MDQLMNDLVTALAAAHQARCSPLVAVNDQPRGSHELHTQARDPSTGHTINPVLTPSFFGRNEGLQESRNDCCTTGPNSPFWDCLARG